MSRASDESQITQAYASALHASAGKQGVVRPLIDESLSLLKVIQADRKFQDFLMGPQISKKQKKEFIDRVFKGRYNQLLLNLFYVTIDKQRTYYLPLILKEYREVAERAEGIYPAEVKSARPLEFEEKLRLKAALEKFTGKTLRVEYEVDPTLLGGLVFRFRDMLIDDSIRGKLTELRRHLMGRVPEAA